MKKSKIAISVLALLGVVTVGGSYFTGKLAEERYLQLIDEINQDLSQLKAAYNIDIKTEDVQFERGFFSSKVQYKLMVKNTLTNQDFSLVSNDTLFHGPLPFNRLKQGNLLPVLASIETKVSLLDNRENIINNPNGVLLNAKIDMGYSGKVSGKGALSEFNYQDDKIQIKLGRSEFEMDDLYQYKLAVPYFKLGMPSLKLDYTIEGVEYQANLVKSDKYPQLKAGITDVKIKSYNLSNITAPNSPPFDIIFRDITLNDDSFIKNDRYNSTGKGQSNLFMRFNKSSEIDLGKNNFVATVDLSANELGGLVTTLEKATDRQQLISSHQFINAMSQLFLADPKIKMDLTLFDYNNDGSQLNFDINLQEAQTLSFDNLKPFKQSSLGFNVNLAGIENLLTKMGQQLGETDEQRDNANGIAKQTIQSLVKDARHTGVVEVTDNELKFNLVIDEGKVKLNQRELSKQELDAISSTLMFILLGKM